jgi:outer membrane protein TolC
MKIRLIFFTLLIHIFWVSAQIKMTLNDCIDYALKHNPKLGIAQVDEKISKMKVGEIRGTGFPQVNSTAKIQQFDPLQRLFVENTGGPFLGDPQKPIGDVIAFRNIFQLPATADFNVSASQLVFSSSYIMALKAAKVYQDLSKKNTSLTRNEIVANVSKAYYQYIVAKESEKILENNIRSLDSSLNQLKVQQKIGFVDKIDVDRLQVSLNNLNLEKEKFQETEMLMKLLLKLQMNMPQDEDFEIEYELHSLDEKIDLPQVSVDYNLRPEYSLLLTQKMLNKIDTKNNKLSFLPTISLFSVWGYNTAHKSMEKLIPATNLWYNYFLYGLQINLPIFDGFTKYYKVQQAKLNEQKTDYNITLIKRNIDFQIKQAEIKLLQERKNIISQKHNLELAQQVANVTKIKYEKGMASGLEYFVSETELRTAQINYYTTLANYYIAKVDYEYALGTIVR